MVLIVVKSDRLSRKLSTLVNTINIAFKSLTESFDTNSIDGKLMFNVLSSFAEYEVSQIGSYNKITDKVFDDIIY